MATKIKYYRMNDTHRGLHYFKVRIVDDRMPKPDDKVVKVTMGNQPKAGRPYCFGITLINYNTFSGNYAWRLDDPQWNTTTKEITKEEYEQAYNIVSSRLERGYL